MRRCHRVFVHLGIRPRSLWCWWLICWCFLSTWEAFVVTFREHRAIATPRMLVRVDFGWVFRCVFSTCFFHGFCRRGCSFRKGFR